MRPDRFRRMSFAFERLEDRWNPADFTVTNGSWNPATQNSLPWCVAQANATAGVDDIYFAYADLQAAALANGSVIGGGAGGNGLTLTSTATLSITEGVRIWGGGAGQYVTLTGDAPFNFTAGDSEIHGTVFDNCKPAANDADQKGGAIQVRGGQVTTFNTRFTNNTANNGGAAFVKEGATLVLDGDPSSPPDVTNYPAQGPVNGVSRTLFQSNTSNTDGGAIESDGTVILRRVYFQQNTAGGKGGGINNNSDTATISVPPAPAGPPDANGTPVPNTLNDVTFRLNSALHGGALSVKGGTVNLIGVDIKLNSAGAEGGGFYVENGTVNVKDSSVTGNIATNGAAIYLLGIGGDAPTMDLKNVSFGNNSARPGGTVAIEVSTGGTLNTHGCHLNGDTIITTIAPGGLAAGTFNPDPNDPNTP